jgi:hypothetical protein
LYKYLHSGDLEELADVIPHEDFDDYTAEDFIEDHATATVGDDDDEDSNRNESNDGDDHEPNAKRFRSDFDSYDQDASNDYDSRYNNNNNAPGIPSLLRVNTRNGQDGKDIPEKSPSAVSPWENNNFNNGSNQNQNSNRQQNNNDRRETRRGSRWSNRR